MFNQWRKTGAASQWPNRLYLLNCAAAGLATAVVLTALVHVAQAAPASPHHPLNPSPSHPLTSRPEAAPTISYALEVNERRSRHYTVHITVPRTEARTLEFAIPAWTPGYYQILHFESGIDRVRAHDEGGRDLPVSHTSPRNWSVSTNQSTGRTVTLDYDVAGSDKGLGFFGSMLDNRREMGYVNGASAFMYVPALVRNPVSLSVALPEGWKFATTLTPTAGHAYSAPSYDELVDSPLQLGAFDSYAFQVGTTPFRCIIAGDRRANAAKVTRCLARIAAEEIGLFGSLPFTQYAFIFHVGEEGFVGGLEHRSSTVIHLEEPIADGNDDEFLATCAHELLHAWNVKRIRPEGLGPFDYSQIVRTPSLWFAEGVTDYYADLIPVRAGLRTPDWFAQQLVQRMTRLDTTAARSRITLEQASLHAWEGQSEGYAGLSYYIKGSLVGAFFDLRICELSGGERCLDDVMRELDKAYGERDAPYPPATLTETLSRVAGRDQSGIYRKYVSGVEEIAWNEVLPTAGFVLNRQEDGYLGASLIAEAPEDDTDDREDGDRPALVDKVEAGLPGESMGLRQGDRLIGIDGRDVNYGLAGAMVRSLPGGVPIRVRVERHGRTLDLVGNTGTQYSHHTLRLIPEADRSPAMRRIQQSLFASRAPSSFLLPHN